MAYNDHAVRASCFMKILIVKRSYEEIMVIKCIKI